MPYSVERFIRVYDDKTGEYYQVGPDRDSLDLVEIGWSGSKQTTLVLTQECALLIAEAIRNLYAPEPK